MRKTRKIFLTAALLLVSVITLITSTYAWFTINQNAQVEKVQLDVTVGNELEISLDGTNWKRSLSFDDIKAQVQNLANNKLKLTAITTQDLNNFYSSYTTDVNNPFTQKGVANRDYLEIDIYFRLSNPDSDEDNVGDLAADELNGLYLSNSVTDYYKGLYNDAVYNTLKGANVQGTYAVSKGVQWVLRSDGVRFKYALDDQDEPIYIEPEDPAHPTADKPYYYAADALRFGIKEVAGFVASDTRDADALAKFIYDPSENPDRGYYKEYGQYDFILKNYDSTIASAKPSQAQQDAFLGVAGFAGTEANNYADAVAHQKGMVKNALTVVGTSEDLKNVNDNQTLCATFQEPAAYDGYRYAKITLSVWLEGWDADCLDAIFADKILMQLYFVAANINSNVAINDNQ